MPDSSAHSERLAQQFHEVYERLAPEYAYETREESRVAWIDVPPKNRELMIATVEEVMGGFFEQYQTLDEAHAHLMEQKALAEERLLQAEEFIAHLDANYRYAEWLERTPNPATRPHA